MLTNSGAALNRNSVYLLIGYLLFQYCMQIGLLMLGYTTTWPMLFLGCILMAGGAQSETTVNSVWVFINCWGKLAQHIPLPFLLQHTDAAELKLEVANANLNATNLVCF